MKKILMLLILVIVAGGAYGGYLLFGQKKTLKIRKPIPLSTATTAGSADPKQEVIAATPDPAIESKTAEPLSVEAPTPKSISVEPSKENLEDFPATITVKDGDKSYTVQYTGQFRRSKKFLIELNTYDIASYVQSPEKGQTMDLLNDLLVDGEVKVYMLRFINALPGRQISNDIYDAINEQFYDVDVDRLQDGINTFCEQFSVGSNRGDIVYIVWLPGGAVYSGFKSQDLSFVGKDVPFARALWRIWAGPKYGEKRYGLVRRFAFEPSTENTTK
jgi:hypothetical protein